MASAQRLKATDVFTPNDVPRYTYVVRAGKNLEKQFASRMSIDGTIVAVSGPTKSGKTVLVRRVVNDSNLILVPCGGIDDPNRVWERVLDKLRVPHATTATRSQERIAGLSGELSTPSLFDSLGNVGKISTQWQQKRQNSKSESHNRRGMTQVVELLSRSEVVVLFDDFHFIPRDVQQQVAQQFKAAAQAGVKIAITVAQHRSDDLERATNQLTGRVANVEITPWSNDELLEIAYEGFPKLNIDGAVLMPHELVREAAGTPQLMQLLCLFAASHCGFEQAALLPTPLILQLADLKSILRDATSMTQKSTVAKIMLNGPRIRGNDRDIYKMNDGTEGDVYACVCKAIIQDPPQLDFSYAQIRDRISKSVIGSSPVGKSIISSLEQMSKLTTEESGERVLDWDEAKRQFSIVDPYLWFYLRWSSFLQNQLHGSSPQLELRPPDSVSDDQG